MARVCCSTSVSFVTLHRAALQACVKDRERPDRRSVHIVMALLNALLLLGLWQLCRKPFGEMAAGIGAVLIAGEPFLAALNGMFHTDAFIAYLSMIAYVALCRSLSLFGKEEEPSVLPGWRVLRSGWRS